MGMAATLTESLLTEEKLTATPTKVSAAIGSVNGNAANGATERGAHSGTDRDTEREKIDAALTVIAHIAELMAMKVTLTVEVQTTVLAVEEPTAVSIETETTKLK